MEDALVWSMTWKDSRGLRVRYSTTSLGDFARMQQRMEASVVNEVIEIHDPVLGQIPVRNVL